VNLRWEIEERIPAIVNRVVIRGNDITNESCIRDQIMMLPGDVFNQERLIASYHSIANLGFFETPLPPPEYPQANDQGDVDIVFTVKEKHTGNVNFGASVGQGYGVGGFIGFDQPNLFGMCKRGSLNWQFGRYINDFSLSYTDPRLKQSQITGSVTAYHQQSRFTVGELGRTIRTGGQLRFGFPVMGSRWTRLFIDYSGERVTYGSDGLAGTAGCSGGTSCFRSSMGLTLDRDTRYDMPFPSMGVHQSITGSFNGGILGGSASFQRYVAEMRSYATLASIGGTSPGSQPIKIIFGLSTRTGALFGNPGPFFLYQQFSLGGVQYGEALRGYEEFSITPRGYIAGQTDTYRAERASFGSAFFTNTAELGLRFNQQFYLNAFYDAGNLWERARDFNPTRLFRGAGVGASLVTPLGPLGIDLGYGFDRVDQFGRRDPKWQVHFKFGQIF
jgi:outer membrane protein insertion porin family